MLTMAYDGAMIITLLIAGPILALIGLASIRPLLRVQPEDASNLFLRQAGIFGSTAAIFIGSGLVLAALDMFLWTLAPR
jgi:hypothetical protein